MRWVSRAYWRFESYSGVRSAGGVVILLPRLVAHLGAGDFQHGIFIPGRVQRVEVLVSNWVVWNFHVAGFSVAALDPAMAKLDQDLKSDAYVFLLGDLNASPLVWWSFVRRPRWKDGTLTQQPVLPSLLPTSSRKSQKLCWIFILIFAPVGEQPLNWTGWRSPFGAGL